MDGQKHPRIVRQCFVQADQRHLRQVGGAALNDSINRVTAGFSNVARSGD